MLENFAGKPPEAELDLFLNKDILSAYQFTKQEVEIVMNTRCV